VQLTALFAVKSTDPLRTRGCPQLTAIAPAGN